MVRLLTFILISLVFLVSAGDKVLIWEVTAPNLPGKAFLAGSIHCGKAQWYPLDAAYDQAFDASSVIYFEIYKLDQQEINKSKILYGQFSDGRKLSHVIGYLDFLQVCQFYAGHGVNVQPEELEQHRPWIISMQISEIYLMQHPEISREFGLESVFTKHLGKKQAGSLESIDIQFKAMSNISDAAAGRLLMEGIREYTNAGRDLKRIFRALETGVPDELSLITNEMAFKHPEFHRTLFVERNQRIAEKIYNMLKEKQTVFILVGAGHFAGKGNILEYLREKDCITVQLNRLNKPGRIKP